MLRAVTVVRVNPQKGIEQDPVRRCEPREEDVNDAVQSSKQSQHGGEVAIGSRRASSRHRKGAPEERVSHPPESSPRIEGPQDAIRLGSQEEVDVLGQNGLMFVLRGPVPFEGSVRFLDGRGNVRPRHIYTDIQA